MRQLTAVLAFAVTAITAIAACAQPELGEGGLDVANDGEGRAPRSSTPPGETGGGTPVPARDETRGEPGGTTPPWEAEAETPPSNPAPPGSPPAKTPTTAENVTKALAFGQSLVGTPYGWWYSGPIPTAAPMWSMKGAPPAASTVKAATVNCAGLTNLMLRSIGKPLPSTPAAGTGGTGAYGGYYASVATPFDATKTYPAGTLIGRRFRDANDQGHVAVVLANGRVLQSFASVYGGSSPGVNTTYTVAQSHDGGYYEYTVAPDKWLGAD